MQLIGKIHRNYLFNHANLDTWKNKLFHGSISLGRLFTRIGKTNVRGKIIMIGSPDPIAVIIVKVIAIVQLLVEIKAIETITASDILEIVITVILMKTMNAGDQIHPLGRITEIGGIILERFDRQESVL